MKKPKIIMTVIKEDIGYSAITTVGKAFIGTEGETIEELRSMALEAVNLTFENENFIYTGDEIVFRYF